MPRIRGVHSCVPRAPIAWRGSALHTARVDGLFQERPCLAGDVRLRDSEEGPLLVRASLERSLLLSKEEATAVTLMDGDHTLHEIAGRVLEGEGHVSYARLLLLIQTLAAGGFLSAAIPQLGAFGPTASLRWLFDLPLLMIPGVGAAAPRMPAWLLSGAILVATTTVAGLLAIPLLVRVAGDPAVAARVGNSWELAVLVLFSLGFLAGCLRGLARAAWLRTAAFPRPSAGLRLRHGLLVIDVGDRGADLEPPGWRARLGTAGLLGLACASLITALGLHFVPAEYATAQPYVAVPLLLLFAELCPFLWGDGGRLAAGLAMVPAARERLASLVLRGSWLQATVGILREDRLALLSTGWLLGAGLLSWGPALGVFSAWAGDLMASTSISLRIAGALPPIAWLALVGYGVVAATTFAGRRLLLARAMRSGRPHARHTMPDSAARRVLLSATRLDVLAEERQRALLGEVRVRVTQAGERLGDGPERQSLFAVQSGSYVLERESQALVELGPGDVFGGLGLLPSAQGDVRIRALQGGRLLELPGAEVAAVLDATEGMRGSLEDVLLTRARLRSCPTLWRLPGRVVDALVGRAELRQLAPDEVLFEVGAPERDLYVVASGTVRIEGDAGRSLVLARGDIAGAHNALAGGPRQWAASAVGAAEVVRLPWQSVQEVVQDLPMFGLALETTAANQRPG